MEIKWKTYEYEYKKRSPDWFWALWIISVAVIFISIMFGSVLFAIFVFVGAFTLSLQAVRKPNLIDFGINEFGVAVGNKIYPYKNIKSYDIRDEADSRIILKLESKLIPFVTIPVAESVDLQKIDGLLLNNLEKENLEEPFTNKLAKYL